MNLHDSHFHLDLCEDISLMIEQIERLKIYTIAVTNLPDLFLHTRQLVKDSKFIRPALGFHPELVANHYSQLSRFNDLIMDSKYIGEVGLDGLNRSKSDFSLQKQALEHILNSCALAGGKVLTLHSRRAESELMQMIGLNFPGKIILHWYSGSLKNLEVGLESGYFFSINSAMTLSPNGNKIISQLPLENILLESDGPFVSFNQQPGWPGHIESVVDGISRIKGIGRENVCKTLHENFKRLLV